MSFQEEWAQLKEDALQRRADVGVGDPAMCLASATSPPPGPAASPTPGATGDPDLGIKAGPIRKKAEGFHEVKAQAKGQSKLDDCEAAGKQHPGWEAGPASDACVAAWQRQLHTLGDMVEAAVDALTPAMNQQFAGDGDVGAKVRAAGKFLDGA
ncbi:hypothetical protein [Streptomyces sp. NPDC056690]|uniref:hypothetical protein n=1 Tax=unclassified Streptomyces TaxID=2593676 RepID=UPI003639E0E7